MNTSKDLNYYLSLPYTIEMIREDESTWFARVAELPGCITEGDSPAEAIEMIYDAMSGWIEVALEDGQPVPEPRSTEEYSGKFVVRVSKSLHRDLVAAAERDDVSLNQYIGTELARAVGQFYSGQEVNAKKADAADPYWPGLQAGLRRVLADAGRATEAQLVDERMCADWLELHLAEIDACINRGYIQDAAGKIDDLSAKLYMVREQSPMFAALRNLLRMLHDQVGEAAKLRNHVLDQTKEGKIHEYTKSRIEAVAQRTVIEQGGDYTRWQTEKRVALGGQSSRDRSQW